jgi:hypothetical protein
MPENQTALSLRLQIGQVQLERERVAIERERVALEREKVVLERERLALQKAQADPGGETPRKSKNEVSLRGFNHAAARAFFSRVRAKVDL